MKKHLLILVTILMSALMICACTGVPSTSTDSGVDDSSSSTNSDTGGDTNDENNDSADKENNSEIGDSTNNDDNNNENSGENDNVDDGTNNDENDNVNGDGSNDNGDGGENDNTSGGNSGNLGNEEPPKEEKPQVNIATQINNAYYKQIYGRYKGDDFPEEYGCYYKAIATYDEFKELFSAVDDPGRAFFNHYYAVIIYEHYVTFNYLTFVGYRDYYHGSITAVYCDADDAMHPEGSYIKNTKYCIAVPKSDYYTLNGTVKEINVTTDSIVSYEYDVNSIPSESASELQSGDAWLITNKEELKSFCEQYGIHNRSYNFEYNDICVLAFYSDVYCNNYIGFRDFFTDGKNVYITCEKIASSNPSSQEKPTIYFVEISNNIIEHEMSEEIVMHFLLQKAEVILSK